MRTDEETEIFRITRKGQVTIPKELREEVAQELERCVSDHRSRSPRSGSTS